jgi:hypothetical protein
VTGELIGERRGAAVRDAVAEPHRRGALRHRHRLQTDERGLPVARPRLWLQRLNRRTRIGGADRRKRRRRLAGCEGRGGDQHDRPVFALGLGQDADRRRLASAPIVRRGPAVVDDQRHRPGAGEPRLRIEQRVGERDDDQCRDEGAQQDQPPRCVRRGFLARGQPEEQPDRRKGDAARRRRGHPQQPPDHRQRGERAEQPWRCKSERTEGEHPPYRRRSAASAAWSASSARCGGRSVR